MQVAWVELDKPAGLRRTIAEALEPSLHDFHDEDEAQLRATFTPRGLRGLRVVAITMDWFDWLHEMAPQWRESSTTGVTIRVGVDGYPEEVTEGGPTSGRVLHLSPTELQDPLEALRTDEPRRWANAGADTGPAPNWRETVDELEPAEGLAVLAIGRAQPLIAGAVLRRG